MTLNQFHLIGGIKQTNKQTEGEDEDVVEMEFYFWESN